MQAIEIGATYRILIPTKFQWVGSVKPVGTLDEYRKLWNGKRFIVKHFIQSDGPTVSGEIIGWKSCNAFPSWLHMKLTKPGGKQTYVSPFTGKAT